MQMIKTTSIIVILALIFAVVGNAFVVQRSYSNCGISSQQSPTTTTTTTLYLEDHIASMIDQELWRQGHKSEYEQEWMDKNRHAVLKSVGLTGDNVGDFSNLMLDDDDTQNFRQHKKDTRMAQKNPQQYCADRCVATGNCDVYEDFFQLSPQQAVVFCEECVLSEDEAPCDIPDAFYENGKL